MSRLFLNHTDHILFTITFCQRQLCGCLHAHEIKCGMSAKVNLINWPKRKISRYSLFVPPDFEWVLFLFFSWDQCKSQEKQETMLMQNFVETNIVLWYFQTRPIRTVPTIVILHTSCASREFRFSLGGAYQYREILARCKTMRRKRNFASALGIQNENWSKPCLLFFRDN